MVTASHSIEVGASRERLFAYMTDPKRTSEWQGNVLESYGDPHMPVGSTTTMQIHVVGQRAEIKLKVLENDGVGWYKSRSIQGPVQFDIEHALKPMGQDRTLVTISIHISAGTIYKLAEPALETVTQTIIETNLKLLKVMAERP